MGVVSEWMSEIGEENGGEFAARVRVRTGPGFYNGRQKIQLQGLLFELQLYSRKPSKEKNKKKNSPQGIQIDDWEDATAPWINYMIVLP